MNDSLDIYNTDITFVKGVGNKRAKLLNKLGIYNIYDALHYYPRGYIDFQNVKAVSDIENGENACVSVTVDSPLKVSRIRNNLTIFKLNASDESGKIIINIFNSRYLAESLQENEEYYIIGKISISSGKKQITPSFIQKKAEDLHFVPIYALTAGISSKVLSNIINNALEVYLKHNISDSIPNEIRKKYNLCHESFALNSIHFPFSVDEVKIARQRLIFEELFFLQSKMALIKRSHSAKTSFKISRGYFSKFLSLLPFELTDAQKRVIGEIEADLISNKQMNRLVQGDVGSGKTAVAASAMYAVAKSGYQSVIMAPTDILAKQHFASLKSFFGDDIQIVLLTGSLTAKKKFEINQKISSGEVQIVVATHAVLYESSQFKALALVVIDEQHRFGVGQRGKLLSKGKFPHLLALSATPIPRTLNLVLYGDLDVSIIDQMPKGRQKVKTYAVDSSYEKRIYNFIKLHLDIGEQCYIICPMVEENEDVDLTSAIEYFNTLRNGEFAEYNVGLLHGKMKAKEKNDVMNSFSEGKIQLLVATTVVEVGVDVPNATVALIKNADRYGLSQLHQIRGRIGRGRKQSYCILMTDSKSENAKQRLNILVKSTNGFEIAEEDLKIRGPGEMLGSMQSGLPSFKIASLSTNLEVVKQAHEAANMLLDSDPELKDESHQTMKYIIDNLYYKNSNLQLN